MKPGISKTLAACAAWGDKTAFLDCSGASLGFAQLHELSLRLGTAFRHMLKGETGRPIAVVTDRSVRCIPVLLGAALSGNFYVPLDGSLPEARRRAMLAAIQPELVVGLAEGTPEAGFRCISVDELYGTLPDADELPPVDGDMPLYGIFTSGSTGFSKLVLKSYAALKSFIKAYIDTFCFSERDVLGSQIPFSFDASTKDLYTPLACGASTLVIDKGYFAQPGRLAELLRDQRITSIVWVPSALSMLSRFDVLGHIPLPDLKRVLFVGEQMPVRQLNIWREALPDALFANLYGASENAGNCLYHVVEKSYGEDERIPLGKPFPGMQVLLLDEAGEIIPPDQPGLQGELCIGGEILALGYYNDPAATAEKFVPGPPGVGRIYRTGDLARYDEAGDLVFCSRRDHQIKLHGYRIELGDIECAALVWPGVDAACCLFDPGKNKLTLCYAGASGEAALRAHLKGALPAHMAPGSLVRLEKMPLNANGKIDRVALARLYCGGGDVP
jgi:amino acid adenylation domain-containing protein